MGIRIHQFIGIFLLIKLSYAQNCLKTQELEQGKIYSVLFPNDPNEVGRLNYGAGDSCAWHFIGHSSSRIKINCDVDIFKLQNDQDCQIDFLRIYLNPEYHDKICGRGRIAERISSHNEMKLFLSSDPRSLGGSFTCYVQSVEGENCDCGRKKLGSWWSLWGKKKFRIVGGTPVNGNEFPMMASIYNIEINETMCGGTIITNKHILTAAHCLRNGVSIRSLIIMVGLFDIRNGYQNYPTQLLPVENYAIHENYNEQSRIHDIAIISVKKQIRFSPQVSPVCLPFQHSQDSFAQSSVEILGFGTTSFGGETSLVLRKATVSVTSHDFCRQAERNLQYSQICTDSYGKDACQFDTGGPVLWQNPYSSRLVLVGIISHGKNCATGIPSINTRITSYLKWILSKTKGYLLCAVE